LSNVRIPVPLRVLEKRDWRSSGSLVPWQLGRRGARGVPEAFAAHGWHVHRDRRADEGQRVLGAVNTVSCLAPARESVLRQEEALAIELRRFLADLPRVEGVEATADDDAGEWHRSCEHRLR